MSVLAPISVHVLIILAAATAVAVYFARARREVVGSQDEE
jgi:hypothetical protein